MFAKFSEKLTFLTYFALGMTLKLKKFSKKVIKIVWGPFCPNMATNEPSLTFGFVSFTNNKFLTTCQKPATHGSTKTNEQRRLMGKSLVLPHYM